MLYDAFICHAAEDKASFVRPLVQRLRENHVEVWYDEFTLRVGDSLRRSIDLGLASSRFGIVVLSPSFFGKQWSQWELDGLVSRQNSGNETVILPVWHGVSKSEVMSYSPPLADKLAVRSEEGLEEVVRRLLETIHPQGSTLVIARDHLLEWECDPPVVTDDWWLDVISAADSNPVEETFQSASGWGRWGFPLPPRSKDPKERGWRLAWAAMQMAWQAEAAARPITQITRPEVVHEFIAAQPGLKKTCHDYLRFLICYAPQLAFRGFGGEFENGIEALYKESARRGDERRSSGDRTGTALTLDGRAPGCDEELAFRDPEFGGYQPSMLAGSFVQGSSPTGGPEVSFFDHIDYVAWLLSDESAWVPNDIREMLTRGMAEWGVWLWHRGSRSMERRFGFKEEDFTGALAEALLRAKERRTFRASTRVRKDVEHRLGFSAALLGLPEEGVALAERFMGGGFVDAYFANQAAQSAGRIAVGRKHKLATDARTNASRDALS